MEPPEGSQEPVARGPADQGVGVVQVPDVDAEEVSKPNDRGREVAGRGALGTQRGCLRTGASSRRDGRGGEGHGGQGRGRSPGLRHSARGDH